MDGQIRTAGHECGGGRLRFRRWGLGQWLYIPKTCCVFFRNCLACVRRCFCVYVYCFQSRFVFSLFRFLRTASTMRRVSSYSCSMNMRNKSEIKISTEMTSLTPPHKLNAQGSRRVLYPACICGFYAIGAYWCYPVVYLTRNSELGTPLYIRRPRDT